MECKYAETCGCKGELCLGCSLYEYEINLN